MSDTPLPDPLDEQASDLLDAGDDAPADQADLGARLDDFRRLRSLLADVPEADPEMRERSMTAALAAFDDLLTDAETDGVEREGEPEVETEVEPEPEVEPSPAVAPVTELASRTARRPSRTRRWFPIVGSAAAVVVVLLGIAALVGGGSDEKASSSAARSDKAAAENSSALASDAAASSGTVAGNATTAAASAGGALAPNPPAAADVGGGATTTAAGAAATTTATATASAGVGETTSTLDVRDVSTTIAAAASTTAPPPSTTTTTVDPTLLPYLGEFSTTDDLAAVLRQPRPTVDPTDDGRTIRTQLAEGSCDIVPFGEPIGVLRWNGRDAVAVQSADAPLVQVIPLDGCNPVALLDAPA